MSRFCTKQKTKKKPTAQRELSKGQLGLHGWDRAHTAGFAARFCSSFLKAAERDWAKKRFPFLAERATAAPLISILNALSELETWLLRATNRSAALLRTG